MPQCHNGILIFYLGIITIQMCSCLGRKNLVPYSSLNFLFEALALVVLHEIFQSFLVRVPNTVVLTRSQRSGYGEWPWSLTDFLPENAVQSRRKLQRVLRPLNVATFCCSSPLASLGESPVTLLFQADMFSIALNAILTFFLCFCKPSSYVQKFWLHLQCWSILSLQINWIHHSYQRGLRWSKHTAQEAFYSGLQFHALASTCTLVSTSAHTWRRTTPSPHCGGTKCNCRVTLHLGPPPMQLHQNQ